MKTEIKKLPKSQLEIEFELTEEEFKKYVGQALEHLKKHVKVDGFREGKAPAAMVEGRLKPEALLMEAGDLAVRESYTNYIKESKLEPVGNPEISIIKIAQGSEFVFKAVITVLPDVELPNYKEIASKVKSNEISVTEQEVEDSVNYLQKTRAKFTAKNPTSPDGFAGRGDFVDITYQNKDINENKPVQDKFILGEAGFIKGFEEQIIGMRAGEEKKFALKLPARHNAEPAEKAKPIEAGEALGGADDGPAQSPLGNEAGDLFRVKVISVQKMELPEINDEFAKQMGAFDTLVALKESVKTGITAEKTEQEKQRKRREILEKIADKAKFEMPVAMVEYEQSRLLHDFKHRIEDATKMKFEEYLASVKQTEEQVKETYKKEAEKRLSGFLVLRELGKKENVEVSDKEVEEEVAKSIKNYSKEQLKQIDINELKEYTKGVLFNEKVFKLLEK